MTDRKAINELKRRQKAITKAISALQEREERSKGCPNCTAGDGEYTVLLDKWGEEDFCPRCGRSLKGADNETD